MSVNEDYLDNLLKSMGSEDGGKPEEEKAASTMSLEEIEAMFAQAEKAAEEEPEAGEPAAEEPFAEGTKTEELFAEEPAAEEFLAEESTAEEPKTELPEDTADHSEEEPEELDAAFADAVGVTELSASEAQTEAEDGTEPAEDPIWKVLAGLDETEGLTDLGTETTELQDEETAELPVLDELMEDSEDILSLLDQQGPVQEEQGAEGGLHVQQAETEHNMPEYAELFGDEGSAAAGSLSGEEGTVQPEKKKGKVKNFFRNLLDRMTEEDEPEDGLSAENRSVMEELEAEDRAAAGKKKKKKKGKMPVSGQEDTEEGQEEGKGKKAGKEKKKASRPKKAKPEKKAKEIVPEEIEEKPSRRVSPKSIAVVILFSLTIFAIVFWGGNLFSVRLQKNAAKKAYEKQDYLTCYESLYGISLSAKEKEMYTHAETVLRMERRIAVYEGYIKEGRELEALDSLMRVISGYENLYTTARECGAAAEVEILYREVLQILQEKYGISETDARAIVGCQSNVTYTRYLTALAEGEELSLESGAELTLPPEELTDVLPSELELGGQNE